MPDHLDTTRRLYDTVAVDYEALLRDELAASTWDRAVLSAFAELVPTGGRVADLGCGPGRLTGHLLGLGLAVEGVDLSPAMIEVARERHPGTAFSVGSLEALDLPDGALAGALAWYSLIHTPPQRLPGVAAELARVLAPGGELVVAFQAAPDGSAPQHRHRDQAYGHEVDLHAWSLAPDHVAALLTDAGLDVHARLVREPDGHEWCPQAYLLARPVSGA